MQELHNLVTGYKEFSNREKRGKNYRYGKLAEGQSPEIMVISCCDSRVIPSLIFDVEPGALFVVRNVANLIPPYEEDNTYHGTSAAIEFAVLGLNIKRIVVMGHSQCGGVQACTQKHRHGIENSVFINKWLSILDPVAEEVLEQHKESSDEETARAMELATVRTSLKNLHTFPFVSEKVAEGGLSTHGAYFDIEDGQLYLLDQINEEFKQVD